MDIGVMSQMFAFLFLLLYSAFWLLMMGKFYSNRNEAFFKNRGLALLTITGISNLLVTIFQFFIITMKENFPCKLQTMGSYLMVSLLHFPYILRSIHHAIMSDLGLRAQLRLFTQKWFPLSLLIMHTVIGVVYFSMFSSGLVMKKGFNTLECGFNIFDGIYMLITLIYYISICLLSVLKIQNFEDRFNISAEIMYVYLIWVVFAVPYLVFEVFLKDMVGAAYFMLVMNILLLYVSFYLPLNVKDNGGHLDNHPIIKVLNKLQGTKKGIHPAAKKPKITLADAFYNRQWTLERILQHEILQEELMELCKKFLCEENPLFLRDVLKYKQVVLNSEISSFKEEKASYDELSQQFMHIWSTYISSKGHLSVNVSCKERARINPKEYKEKNIGRKACVFDACYLEIENMLMQNLRQMLSAPKTKGSSRRLLYEGDHSFHRVVSNGRMILVSSPSISVSKGNKSSSRQLHSSSRNQYSRSRRENWSTSEFNHSISIKKQKQWHSPSQQDSPPTSDENEGTWH